MGKVNDTRKKQLQGQLESALVEKVGTPSDEPGLDENYWSVFVPGATREFNYVEAESEEEAKEKVRKVLESKIDQMPEQPAENVEVTPENLEVKMKSTVKAVEGEENG